MTPGIYFLYTVLHKTRSDLAAAEEKMDEIMKEQGNDDQGEMYQELRSVMPVSCYDQMCR